jgi:hypothetical protein
MEFLVVMHQEGGCDYTIECGTKTEKISADSTEAALKKAQEICSDHIGDYRLSAMSLYQISWSTEIPVDELYASIEEERKRWKQIEKENQEKQEYERLKKKFG